VVKCPEEVAKPAVDCPESEVFLLKRIRYVDDDAVSIEESWVPVGLIPDPDAIGISLYDYFRSQNISRSAPVHGSPACRTASFRRTLRWTKNTGAGDQAGCA
jgi:DNA-binding GntR family transcriptional regulator